MGVDVDALLTVVNIAFEHLNNSSYPDSGLLSSLSKSCKSNADAAVLRNLGNVDYKEGNHYDALLWYTRSVASAAEHSQELALAYGNRSAVLLRLHKYDACLLDVNRALKCVECPKVSKTKLQNRKLECLNLISRHRSHIKKDETDPVASIKNSVPNCRRDTLNNPLLLNTTPKIKLACDEKWGRYMVAAKDIEPGNYNAYVDY